MAARRFETFDFANCPEWRSYYENIFPVPSHTQLSKIKQKWYKEHIDKDFNAESPSAAAGGSQGVGSGSNSSSSSSSNPRPNRGSSNRGSSPSTLQLLQTSLFLLSVPAFFFGKALHLIVAGHVAGIIHYHNMPKMNLEYWRPVISDDNLHSLAFALLFLIVPTSSVWMVPAYIGVLVYVPEVILKTQYFPGKVKEFAGRLERNKIQLLQARADSEAWLGFALLVLCVIGACHWITPIVFWQYTRMRYILNYFSKITFGNIRVKGDQMFQGKPLLQNVWEKIKGFCNWLNTIEANQAPGSSCQIF